MLKNAELIIAWANGARIEFFANGAWHFIEEPKWLSDTEYRIKPERVWPVTSLQPGEIMNVVRDAKGDYLDSYFAIANAAIKRYIEDNEK